MSINLSKYRDSLVAAWKDVLEDKTDTNWALFGYEGQTNDLKVITKGSQGIEELVEDLNSSKIMYAFLKINDPKTSLPKCVLINWQGEGANVVRKGMCANHLRDVESFFTGAHITINARTEEEVEPEIIINKVSKSGSAYSFKAPRSDTTEPTKPIGTNYKRVNPVREINARERDQFWLQEEQEEKKRLEAEHTRKEAERLQHEEEIKQRELVETAAREAKSTIRDHQIEETKQAERVSINNSNAQDKHALDDVEIKINQSEMLRQQRNQEAQDLIAQRTIDARLIFEQNTAVGQISKRVPQKPVRSSLLKAQNQQNIESKQQMIAVNALSNKLTIEEQPSDDESVQFSTIKRSPRDNEKKAENAPSHDDDDAQEHSKNTNGINQDNSSLKENRYSKATTHMEEISAQQFVDEMIYHDYAEGTGLQARALYDYQAADDTEITFDPGDIISNIDQVDEGWWQGMGPDGTYGLFPANYVELIH